MYVIGVDKMKISTGWLTESLDDLIRFARINSMSQVRMKLEEAKLAIEVEQRSICRNDE